MRLANALGRAGPIRPARSASHHLRAIKTAHVIALRKLQWHVFVRLKFKTPFEYGPNNWSGKTQAELLSESDYSCSVSGCC